MLKKLIISAVTFVALCSAARAQEYNWGIGIRGGGSLSGVDVRYNFNPSNSFHGIMAFTEGFNFVGLYEWNVPVISEGFSLFYGVGANIGAWGSRHNRDFQLGIDGIVGLEYAIPEAPIALAIDYKPFFNLFENTEFIAYDFGFSVKYTF